MAGQERQLFSTQMEADDFWEEMKRSDNVGGLGASAVESVVDYDPNDGLPLHDQQVGFGD